AFLNYSQPLLSWIGWENLSLDSEHLLTSVPMVVILLIIPLVATYITHRLTRLFDSQMPDYLTVIYAYLPMTLGINLAYYIPAAITEAGDIFAMISQSFGLWGASLPSITGSMDVAIFLQGVTLLLALLLSFFPLLKISQRPLSNNLPHIGLMSGFILVFFNLID
ncbi:MAG: 4Fe-4S binding protein, partial [Crocosphaera sp.]